jgi:hypothetical protein
MLKSKSGMGLSTNGFNVGKLIIYKIWLKVNQEKVGLYCDRAPNSPTRALGLLIDIRMQVLYS